MTASRFLAGNRGAELKPTSFSSLLLLSFPVLPLLLTPQRCSAFECYLLRLLLNIICITDFSFLGVEVKSPLLVLSSIIYRMEPGSFSVPLLPLIYMVGGV